MTPQNINHLIDAIATLVGTLCVAGLFTYMITTLFKDE